MKHPLLVTVVLCGSALSSDLWADKKFVDCGRGQSLNQALKNLNNGDTLGFTGTCKESVAIPVSGITLAGQGTAIISPPNTSSEGVDISGVQRVTLQNFTVQNASFGIHALAGAGITLQGIVAQNNAASGILVESNSSAYLANVSSQGNGLHGIDLENTSSLICNGNVLAQQNGVFGVNIATTSSATVNVGTMTAQQNALGIQVSINSSFFLSNPAAAVKASNNFTVGLTMVSGAHFFSFGGTITTSGNGLDGIDLASRAGMDLDAASQASSFNNGRDGLHLEQLSLVNLFNNPMFSGVPGSTMIQVYGNSANGVSLLNNSQLHMFDQAAVQSHNNTGGGIQVDDGSSLLLINSTVQSNQTDIALTFGSRGDLTKNTIGTLKCDASSLLRGDTGKTCPAP